MEGWRAKGVEEGTSRAEGDGAGDGKALKPFMESELVLAGVEVDDEGVVALVEDWPALPVGDELDLLVDEVLLSLEVLEGDSEVVDGRPVGRPWAARALTTASQPRSRVRMRSLSSSFSLSRSCSLLRRISSSGVRRGTAIGMPAAAEAATLANDARDGRARLRGCGGGGDEAADGTGRPARRRRFSSSSSWTLRSR